MDLYIFVEDSYLFTHPFTSKSCLLPQIPVFHAQKALTAKTNKQKTWKYFLQLLSRVTVIFPYIRDQIQLEVD